MRESLSPASPSDVANESRAIRILAKSVHRELRESGYASRDMISFANELLELVMKDVREGT
jgi:hypothetical protein